MKISTALNWQQKFISRLNIAYTLAEHYGWRHEKLINKLKEDLYDTDEWKRCPRHVHEFVLGYSRARYDALWRIMVSCFLSYATGKVYYDKYPELPEKITFLGHSWPNKEQEPKWYSCRSPEDIEDERKKRGA